MYRILLCLYVVIFKLIWNIKNIYVKIGVKEEWILNCLNIGKRINVFEENDKVLEI